MLLSRGRTFLPLLRRCAWVVWLVVRKRGGLSDEVAPLFYSQSEMQMSWDTDLLDLAQWWASRRSKDPSTKVGAVVVNDHHEILSIGYNGFPRGFPDDPDLYYDRDFKLRHIAHAERNALDLAKGDVTGATIYVSPLPMCAECAKTVVQRRLKRVVVRGDLLHHERWRESWADAKGILHHGGVEVVVCELV